MALLSLLATDPSLLAVLFWGSLELPLEQQLPIVERERGGQCRIGGGPKGEQESNGVFLGS